MHKNWSLLLDVLMIIFYLSKSTWKWFGGTEVFGSLSLLGTLMSAKFVDKCYFYLNLFVATVICSHENILIALSGGAS